MASQRTGTQLPEFLDLIEREQEDKRGVAIAASKKLSALDKLVLSAWDVGATYLASSGRIELIDTHAFTINDAQGEPVFRVTCTEVEPARADKLLIEYVGGGWYANIDPTSPLVPQVSHRHQFWSLLLALQYSRDHLDTILLYPPEMRNDRIAQLAESSELEEIHFRRLAGWAPAIKEYSSHVQ